MDVGEASTILMTTGFWDWRYTHTYPYKVNDQLVQVVIDYTCHTSSIRFMIEVHSHAAFSSPTFQGMRGLPARQVLLPY